MTTQEMYKNAFDQITTDTTINEDTLKSRQKQLKRKHARSALCCLAAFAVLFLGSNAISYAKNGGSSRGIRCPMAS